MSDRGHDTAGWRNFWLALQVGALLWIAAQMTCVGLDLNRIRWELDK